jgi:dTDP-4-amino-4,6-dideoxygalactose transaminase
MKITYGKQYIDKSDEKIILKTLYENKITEGNKVSLFENTIKKKLKSKFCVVCNSATSGLFLSMKAIKLQKNDIIIMPAVNFIASYSMAKFMGAKIILCDVDKFTGQITPETLKKCIKLNKLRSIKALITMYLGGYPNNIFEFYKLKKKYKFFIIEDACHAFGASYSHQGRKIKIGSNKHSDLSVFSFHPVKPITTGEGGAITTNNKNIYQNLKILRSHGVLRKKNYWDYDINNLSFNFRISDINCALGISQSKKITNFIKKRKTIFRWYKEFFKNKKNFKLIIPNHQIKPSYHLILLNIDFNKLNLTKNSFMKKLNKKNIFPQFHYKPIQLFSFYKKKEKNLKNSLEYMEKTISIPVFHELSKNNVKNIVKSILFELKKN